MKKPKYTKLEKLYESPADPVEYIGGLLNLNFRVAVRLNVMLTVMEEMITRMEAVEVELFGPYDPEEPIIP